ncbi:MAG: hypothetical protein V4484_11425 [Pseudomonadota bacterium]
MIREFLFEAHDADGQLVQNSVVATDVADAKGQLARMGYRDISVRTGELQGLKRDANWDATSAARRINAGYHTLPVAVLNIFRARWLFWMPGAALAAWQYGTGRAPYLGLALLVTGLLHTALKALPSVLYNQLLWARVHGRYALGLRYVTMLGTLSSGISAMNIAAERAKMLAGLGRVDEALAGFSVHEHEDNRVAYLTQLVAIHDTAGRRDSHIAVQRDLLEASGQSKEIRIDLAWSLMRYTTAHEEARALIADLHPSNFAEMFGAGLRIVQAMLDQAEGRHQNAIAALRKEHALFARYSSPLLAGMRAELCAYIALSMKAEGQLQEADALWQQVLPLMRIHHHDLLIARYQQLA